MYAKALEHVKRKICELLNRFGSSNMQQMAKRKNPAAVALGRKGGKKSAVARMEKLTPEQRSAIAKNAAQARWSKGKGE